MSQEAVRAEPVAAPALTGSRSDTTAQPDAGRGATDPALPGRRSDLEADAVHAFGVFAEHLSFTAAAAALHIAQPSLHVKIRKLGAALGVELYRRQGRGLVLTEAGRQLAAYAHDAHRRADDLLATLRGTSGTVAVAAGRGACRWVVADGLRALAASGRNLTVTTARREAALTALHDGRVDVAVIAHDPPPGSLRSHRLGTWPQVHMVPPDHPHAARAGVTVADLSGAALVVPPAERPHRRALHRALDDAGVPWRVAAEVDGWDLQVHLAGLGVGTTVVNGCVPAPDGWAAVPISDLPGIVYWSVWRPGRDALLADALTLLHTRPGQDAEPARPAEAPTPPCSSKDGVPSEGRTSGFVPRPSTDASSSRAADDRPGGGVR